MSSRYAYIYDELAASEAHRALRLSELLSSGSVSAVQPRGT